MTNSPRNLHVAFADNDEDGRKASVRLMRVRGYEVAPFTNADALFTYLEDRQSDVDIVVTDHEMPGTTGVQLLQRIRKDIRCRSVPVIVHTAHQIRASVETAWGIYADKTAPGGLSAALEIASAQARRRVGSH